MWLILCICVIFVQNGQSQFQYTETQSIVYQIAGIFESPAITQYLAFNESIRHAHLDERQMDPTVLRPNRTDSYSVWRELCRMKSVRPIAIFGPQNPITDGAIRDQCAIANIPHVQAAWQPFNPDLELNEEETEPAEESETGETPDEEKEAEETGEQTEEPGEPEFKKITINFYPDADEISFAYAQLLKYYKWENFAAFYEDDYGLLRIQQILAEHTDQHPVVVRKLDPDGDNFKVFKDVKKYQESRFLLDCHVDRIQQYMNIAEELEMVKVYQHYILMSPDASMLAEKLLPYNANITWLSFTDYDQLKDAQHSLAPRVGRWKVNDGSPPVTDFQIEALILDDVANHVLKAVREVELALEMDQIPPPSSHVCDSQPWSYGAILQNQILKTRTTGVTGNVQFDEMGRRVNYTLYINEIHLSKRTVLGRWKSDDNETIIIDKPHSDEINDASKHFIIISRKAKPYFYDKTPCTENCTEEDKDDLLYEGFSVDLVKHIFDILRAENNSYTFEFVFDKDKHDSYGIYNKDEKKWTGLFGELLDNKADLAVCDLTITEERKQVVDFSVPFMSLGISILYIKEDPPVPAMFSFLNPYSFDVWMHIATAYCIVSIVLFVCARISPEDWENPQPCDKDPEELENIWNFKNCTWLTMGSIMTQGCDILPKAFGSRWVCSMWWFFAVIVCQTYIAQLSAAMTSAMENEPVNSIEDLANQNKILYGAINGGSTFNFFKNSKDKMFQTMYQNMIANPAVLVTSNDEGEKRVVKGKSRYAFLMESCTIEYKLKRNCDLKKIGGELDSKDYGIAMPANSPFRSKINRAILKLKELTILDEIKKKWWEKKYDAKDCEVTKNENDVEGDLEIDNLIGAFLVLIMGIFLGVLITAAEFMNEVRNIVIREQVTHKEAFIKELKASLNFFQLQKPILRNPSRAASMVPSEMQRQNDDKQSRRVAAIENFLDFEKQPQ